MTDKPEALRLADELPWVEHTADWDICNQASNLLIRLHKANDELLGTLKHARDLVAEWGACASAYEQEKYGLKLDLKQLDVAIQRAEKT